MLQGVLRAFQLGTLADYLDKSFAEPASINVKLKLCKSHMIKSFVNKVSTYSSIPKKDRKILNVFLMAKRSVFILTTSKFSTNMMAGAAVSMPWQMQWTCC